MEASELTAERLRALVARLGTLKAEWFESVTCSVSPSPDDYRAMLLREDEPGSSAIIAQMMLDQDALDLAELANAVPQIIAMMDDAARTREALAWYAEQRHWRSMGMHMCGHAPDSAAANDKGERARAALQREPKETDDGN